LNGLTAGYCDTIRSHRFRPPPFSRSVRRVGHREVGNSTVRADPERVQTARTAVSPLGHSATAGRRRWRFGYSEAAPTRLRLYPPMAYALEAASTRCERSKGHGPVSRSIRNSPAISPMQFPQRTCPGPLDSPRTGRYRRSHKGHHERSSVTRHTLRASKCARALTE
jgi:hypothetical protein